VGTKTGPETCFGGSTACSPRPVKVVGGLAFRAVNVGSEYSCGLTTGDLAYCWGDNTAGQLGNGTDSSVGETRPVAVVSP
jgi:alpha-tubulin suppressor-like RCC1 family protein